MNKQAIVTGAAGFLGANLVQILSAHSYIVYAIVRPGSSHNMRLSGIKNVYVTELDIDKISQLPNIIKPSNNPIDIFYHLAWHGNRYDPIEQYINIDEALRTIEVASKMKCRRWIATGSQAEYGSRKELLTEDLIPDPFCAYGTAKVAACYTTKYYAGNLGVDWIWARIHSLYGKYEPSGRMLPDLVKNLKSGKDVDLSSCTQYWNYLDARDASEALIALGERGHSGEIYNIAAEESRPLKDYVEIIHAMYGQRLTISYGNPPSPFVSLRPSIDKLKHDTGWTQKISFKTGLQETHGSTS